MRRLLARTLIPLGALALLPAPAAAATPTEEIAAAAAPAPNYADPAMWSHAAEALPAGAGPAAQAAKVDVFYVHPTILRTARPFNQDLADAAQNRMTDESAIARQASVFTGCCAVYAPRYRAAGPGSLVTPGQRDAAFALAYSDVERAFDWFLANVSKGRPFIIAGHSQGAMHLAALLESRIDGTPLRNRLVAAYIVGINLAEGEFGPRFKTVTPCAKPAQTGCVVQWNAITPEAKLDPIVAAFEKPFFDKYGDVPGRRTLCVNPVTYDMDRPSSLSAQSVGAVPGAPELGAMRPLVPGKVAVTCERGLARTFFDPALDLKALPGGSLHYNDIGLFWADLRANAALRAAAWQKGEAARVAREDADLRARYGLPGSRFVTLAGQRLHYVDEGKGPAVVLVHGSYDSLRSWDTWAAGLRRHYRVIRFDRAFSGLSGPAPDGRGDGEAEALLIGRLADHLKLGRFTLVGTSSSGEGAAHFAAIHPERLKALILANIAARPFRPDPSHYTAAFRAVLAADARAGGWHAPALWQGILEMNYFDKAKITPALVQRWTDFNNRHQGAPRVLPPGGKPFFSGTPADLAAIRTPTLLLWSDHDPETPVETHGQEALGLLAAKDKSLVVIPRCGHMMPEECGPESLVPARAFLDRVVR